MLLIDTTVAVFWAHASLVGIGLDTVLTLYSLVDIGGPSMIVIIRGPRPGNVAKGI